MLSGNWCVGLGAPRVSLPALAAAPEVPRHHQKTKPLQFMKTLSGKTTGSRLAAFVASLFLYTSAVAAWESSILHYDASGERLVYHADETGQRIVDFSHAGYRAGEAELPDVPVVLTISPVEGDNTSHIQDAINRLAARPLVDGRRGAIVLKAGSYPVNGIVYIHTSGIVLRGEGQGNTVRDTIIRATGTAAYKELGTIVVKSNTGINRKEGGTEQNVISEFIPAGSRSLEVEDASMYSVGDQMVIEHRSTHDWLMAVNYGNTNGDMADEKWGDTTSEDMFFYGTITAIDGNKIKLDTPIYHEIDRSLAQATIYRHPGTGIVEECGVENLRVQIQSNGGSDESHRWDAVHFIGAKNCWVRDTTATGFAESGFRFSRSTRSTAINCSALDPVSQIGGGRRYNFYIGGDTHDILVKQGEATYGRHCFVGNGAASTNGIVFTQSTSRFAYSSSENHRRWGSAFLWDDMTWSDANTSGAVLSLHNRGNFGTAHGWTGTGFVAWNVDTGNQNAIICSDPPIGQNFAIGCNANVIGGNHPAGYIEPANGEMEIPSLYEAQLEERLNYGIGPDMPGRSRVSHYTNDASPFVVLEWLDIALEETAYVVERSSNGGNSYFEIATLPADSVSYTDTSVAQNGTYTYRVSATNSIGRSAYSNPVTLELSSSKRPEVITYQPLEDTVGSGISFRWDRHNFTGKGFINLGDSSTWFEMEIDGGKGGPTDLTFRYGGAAPSSGSGKRSCNISVNGVIAGETTFLMPSSSWEYWGTETITINLDRGINTIRVQPSTGDYGPYIDRIDVQATPVMYAAGETRPAEAAAMAFDSDDGTHWRHASPHGSWLQFAYGAPVEVVDYQLTSGEGESANNPADWQLLGSNDDGSSWTVLDARSNQTFSSRVRTKTFSVTNSGSYSLYRLDISEVRNLANADSVQLAELRFLLDDLPPVSPDPAAFSEAPHPVNETAISMTSVTGSSALASVEYYFAETSGNPGGTDSGWISSPSYTDTGLNVGAQYTYTVTMRDAPDNVGTPSSPQSATTYIRTDFDWNAGSSSDGLWTTDANWSGGVAPLEAEQYLRVRFDEGPESTLDQTAVVAQLIIGDSTGALFDNRVTLASGADLTAGLSPFGSILWTGVGYNNQGTLTVEEGAVLTTASHLWVGFNASGKGKLIIDGGTVNVGQQFGLGWNGGFGSVELRAGRLNLNQFNATQSISGESSLDIENGRLVIGGDRTTIFADHVSAGQITAFGGDGEVVIDYDAQSDETTVTALFDVTVLDSVARINFQPGASAVPAGYWADSSQVFGDRGNGFSYGWTESFDVTRERGTHVDQRFDTLNHTQADDADHVWEIGLPNGDYVVNLTGGDPDYDDSYIEFIAEAGTANQTTLVSGDAGVNFVSGSAAVTVSDGRLSISNGSNANNNKINFVDIFLISVSDSYEDWKAEHAITDDLADEDNDGISNLLEFALGGDPHTPGTAKLPQASVSGDNLNFTLQRQAVSLTYVIEISTDLINWDDFTEVTEDHGSSGGQATVSVPNMEMVDGRLFLRLRVER